MMMAPETGSRTRRACAAVVLYRPDIPVLAKQAQGLAGVRLFAFANGSLDPGALAALAPTDLVLIESAENLGLGHGLNILMEAAREEGFDHVLLLDQDSEPAADLNSRIVCQGRPTGDGPRARRRRGAASRTAGKRFL